MSEYIKDVSQEDFMVDVIEESAHVPVIVDFWAPWCGPCKQLMPALERAVNAAKGKVKMVKINIDDNPGLAQQLQVRSVPMVYAFKDGQPVDGFTGAQPESELNKFISRITGETDVSAEAQELVVRAQGAVEAGDLGGAAQDYAQALSLDPSNTAAIAGLGRMYLEGGAFEQAEHLLAQVPDDLKQDPAVKSIVTALALQNGAPKPEADNAHDGGEDAELVALQAAVDTAPNDHDARLALAKAQAARGDNAGAMDNVLHSIALDRAYNDEAARMFLLTLFEAEGAESELAKDGRRRLSSILFA